MIWSTTKPRSSPATAASWKASRQEAIALAGHLKLKNLIVIWDDNNITIDGRVSMSDSTDQLARFAASGWNTLRCDGHDYNSIRAALLSAQSADRPTMIACKTIIGKGAPNKKDSHAVHGSPLGAEEIAAARKELGWTAEPFVVPQDILIAWRAAGVRSKEARFAWEKRLAASPHKSEFTRITKGDLPASFGETISNYKKELAKNPPHIATRNSSQNALDVINAAVPETIGGSADLTGSNNTKSKEQKAFSAANYGGCYVYFGIREHGMAAASTAWRCTAASSPMAAPSSALPIIAGPPSASQASWASAAFSS